MLTVCEISSNLLYMKEYTVHTEEEKQKIINLKTNGLKDKDIAEQVGVKFSYVRKLCRKLALKAPPGTRSKNAVKHCLDEEIRRAGELHGQGYTYQEVAEMMGKSKNQVQTLIQKSGIVYTKEQAIEVRTSYDSLIKAKAIELRLNYKTLEEISNVLGISYNTAKYICSDINLFQLKIKKLGLSSNIDYLRYLAKNMDGILLDSEYFGMVYKYKWKCNNDKHEPFMSTASDVKDGHWCPVCGKVESKAEAEILLFIKSLGVDALKRQTIFENSKVQIDVYCPERQTGFEHHGLFCHSELWDVENKKKHYLKYKQASENGIRLIQIFEDEWLNRRPQIEGLIRSVLHKVDHRIGARECDVQKCSIMEVNQFLNDNHIQGAAGKIAYKMIYDGEMVSCMTFTASSNSRMGAPEEGVWELTRYCVKMNHNIIGGFQKLFSKFNNDYRPNKVISYSDNRWSYGDLYIKNGFKLDSEIAYDYSYFKSSTKGPRIHKSKFRKDNIAKKFGIEMNDKTEWEAMQKLGFDRIWDAGKKRWVWKPTML